MFVMFDRQSYKDKQIPYSFVRPDNFLGTLSLGDQNVICTVCKQIPTG